MYLDKKLLKLKKHIHKKKTCKNKGQTTWTNCCETGCTGNQQGQCTDGGSN